MVHRHALPTSLLAAVGLLAAACGGGSNVSNASPRLTEVPLQSTTGGGVFTLDLDAYVADREGSPLTYSVVSGGGTFTGSSYSNTFDTMGEYTVEFTVTDGSKTTTGEFEVRVTTANLVAVREGVTGLLLLDSGTNRLLRVAGSTSTPSLAAGLTDGRLVYQLAAAAGQQLWLFDPLTRVNTRVAGTATGDVTYRAKTSDNKFVYSTGTGDDLVLFFYSPATGVSREINQGALSTLTVSVNASDLVFYEVGVSGQADVYYYDPSVDDSFAVGTASTNEQILAVMPDGGVVFSRVGGGGETDLLRWRLDSGLVEIGTDVTGMDSRNKAYHAYGSSSQVVFSAANGVNNEIFSWSPATGQTTTVASGNFDVYAAIGAGNEVVYNRVVSGTEADAFFYDLDSTTAGTVRNAADISLLLGVSSDGTTAWAFVRGSGDTSNLRAVSLVGTPVTQTYAAGGAVSTTAGVLTNGDVVCQRQDGTSINVFDVSLGTWGTAIVGTGLSFEGDGIDAGDFVYTVTASSQTDLSMWDASATTSLVVSSTAGADDFQIRTANSTILFTRVATGNTNADLHSWDGTVSVQLTNVTETGVWYSYAVLGQFTGTR